MNWEAIKTVNTFIVIRSTTTLDGYHVTAYDLTHGMGLALGIFMIVAIMRLAIGRK